MQTVQGNDLINISSPSTISFDFNSGHSCLTLDTFCKANYQWSIIGPGVSLSGNGINPVFSQLFNQVNSTYIVSISATCGSQQCGGYSFKILSGCENIIQVPKQYTICTIIPSNISSSTFNVTATQ